MKQYATVLNFAEALLLTNRGQSIARKRKAEKEKRALAKPARLVHCHDGVWRMLIMAHMPDMLNR